MEIPCHPLKLYALARFHRRRMAGGLKLHFIFNRLLCSYSWCEYDKTSRLSIKMLQMTPNRYYSTR